MSRAATAACLGISVQTLCAWRRQWRGDRLAARPRGRPCSHLPKDGRARVAAFAQAHWPHCSRERLRRTFPDLPVRALDDLHARIGRLRRRNESELIYVLRWTRPGAVWAMDYTKPPLLVDGVFGKILNVRDLASGKTLESLPVPEESAAHTRALLLRLFLQHGAPLVVKSDNGSPLVAEGVRELLYAWGVTFLLSPPYWPRYNGACEAGNGSLKTRAHHIAVANGRVAWSCDDVEAARLLQGELVCDRKNGGKSPDEVWEAREPISERERNAFEFLLQTKREGASIEMQAGLAEDTSDTKRKEMEAEAERNAVSRTLESSGLLIVRRKRIPLRKKR